MNMKEKPQGFISGLFSSKTNFTEVIILAILLSLSVNLISSSIPSLFNLTDLFSSIFGLIIICLSVIYLIIRFFKNLNKTIEFDGFIIYDNENNSIWSTPRYGFGENLAWYFKSAFSENPDIKELWDKNPLSTPLEIKNGVLIEKPLFPQQLIVQATEYYILKSLSNHLNYYFYDKEISKNYVETFSRTDIPGILFENQFLELFSKPQEERAAFIGNFEASSFETVYAISESGATFDQFKLTLPKGSKLSRGKGNCIEINTNRFKMIISLSFSGSPASFPYYYHRYILDNHDSIRKTDSYLIKVNIDLRIKFISFLTSRGWNVYNWIDSFIEELFRKMDYKTHLNLIGFERSLTIFDFLSDKYKSYRIRHNSPSDKSE